MGWTGSYASLLWLPHPLLPSWSLKARSSFDGCDTPVCVFALIIKQGQPLSCFINTYMRVLGPLSKAELKQKQKSLNLTSSYHSQLKAAATATTVYVTLYICIILYSLENTFRVFSLDLPNNLAQVSSRYWWKTAVCRSKWYHVLEVSQLLSDRAGALPQVFWNTTPWTWHIASWTWNSDMRVQETPALYQTW